MTSNTCLGYDQEKQHRRWKLLDKVDFREIWPQLIGLVPVYGRDSSNGTEIRLVDRRSLYSPLRTKTLLRRLARVFTIDLRAARDKYSALCGRCYAVPIPMRPGLVLVPVHARYARFKDDGTRAYLVKSKIAGLNRLPPGGRGGCRALRAPGADTAGDGHEEMRTRLVFTDGSHLDVPHDMQGIRSLLLLAEKVEREAELPGGGKMPCRGVTGDTEMPCRGLPRLGPGPSFVSERPPHDCIYRLWSFRPEEPE